MFLYLYHTRPAEQVFRRNDWQGKEFRLLSETQKTLGSTLDMDTLIA
jgi:hypothetical protein